MRLDHLLSKETWDLKESLEVLRLASGALEDTLFNLEGTGSAQVETGV